MTSRESQPWFRRTLRHCNRVLRDSTRLLEFQTCRSKASIQCCRKLASLLQRDGEELERHYRKILDELGKKSGMLGASGCERQGASRRFGDGELKLCVTNPWLAPCGSRDCGRISKTPPRSAEGIVDSVDTENWSSMQADTKNGESTKDCSKRVCERQGASRRFVAFGTGG